MTKLYRDLLLREPDTDGLNYWVEILESGAHSLEEVASDFLASDEFHNEVQPALTLYQQELLRPADSEGLRYWVDELRQVASINDIRSAMQPSSEAGKDVAVLDDTAWLEGAYASLLHREPDADAEARGLDDVTWDYSVPEDDEGNITSPGNDAIAVGMLYNSEAVTPLGAAVTKTDGAFATANRAPLLQTFEEIASGEVFSAVVNHFKSKGSVVNGEDAIGDGQGNNNPTRVEAAEELLAWLASDPTASGDSDVLILGDLNTYAMEDPITTLLEAGYTRLNDDYSYVFDGAWGSLDHALASDSLLSQVSGTTTWHINADEASALDYNTDFTSDRQDDNLYAPDAFRSSDHDPILVGLDLGEGVTLA